MEKIYVGKGVYRSQENTMLFEVYTPEQMKCLKENTCYEYIRKNKITGGFHGEKVLAYRKKLKGKLVGSILFENIDKIHSEQAAVIKTIVGGGAAPEMAYDEYGLSTMKMKHDHSRDDVLAIDDNAPEVRSEGTNISPDNINPETGQPYSDDEHEPLDESFVGGDDAESDGDTGNESEGSPGDGDAAASVEPKKQAKAGQPAAKSGKSKASRK